VHLTAGNVSLYANAFSVGVRSVAVNLALQSWRFSRGRQLVAYTSSIESAPDNDISAAIALCRRPNRSAELRFFSATASTLFARGGRQSSVERIVWLRHSALWRQIFPASIFPRCRYKQRQSTSARVEWRSSSYVYAGCWRIGTNESITCPLAFAVLEFDS